MGGWSGSSQIKETFEIKFWVKNSAYIKSSTEIIFVKDAILVDVHKLEAVLVHLQLLLGEPALILALA